MHLKEDKL